MATLKTQVTSILVKPEIANIKFSLAGISIDQNSYKEVKAKIDNDKITVSYSDKIGQEAKYRYTANTLFLGFKAIDTSDKEALVVHECTHAALDILGKSVLVKYSEAAAFVAQCLYFYYVNQLAISKGSTPTFNNPVLKAAWDAAAKARQNSTLSMADIGTLLTEISNDSHYKSTADKNENFDGVS